MSALLNVEFYFKEISDNRETASYKTEYRSGEAEEQMLHLYELISELKSNGKTMHIKFYIEVDNIDKAVKIINKNFSNSWDINNCKLSHREIEIIELITMGLTTKEIADKLCISFETVKSHRRNILDKTGARNTPSLINFFNHPTADK